MVFHVEVVEPAVIRTLAATETKKGIIRHQDRFLFRVVPVGLLE